jgi:hypothetical protein
VAHADIRADYRASKGRLIGLNLKTIGAIGAAFRSWRRTAARRRSIADFTPQQLKDIGYAAAPRQLLEIEAGLITDLMEWR